VTAVQELGIRLVGFGLLGIRSPAVPCETFSGIVWSGIGRNLWLAALLYTIGGSGFHAVTSGHTIRATSGRPAEHGVGILGVFMDVYVFG
jgi:hypothetical protein